jgi:hypothetical protein
MPSNVKANLLDDGVVDTLVSVGAKSGVHTQREGEMESDWPSSQIGSPNFGSCSQGFQGLISAPFSVSLGARFGGSQIGFL